MSNIYEGVIISYQLEAALKYVVVRLHVFVYALERDVVLIDETGECEEVCQRLMVSMTDEARPMLSELRGRKCRIEAVEKGFRLLEFNMISRFRNNPNI